MRNTIGQEKTMPKPDDTKARPHKSLTSLKSLAGLAVIGSILYGFALLHYCNHKILFVILVPPILSGVLCYFGRKSTAILFAAVCLAEGTLLLSMGGLHILTLIVLALSSLPAFFTVKAWKALK